MLQKTCQALLCLFTFANLTPVLADGAIVGLLTEPDHQIIADFNVRRDAAIETAHSSPDKHLQEIFSTVMDAEPIPIAEGYDPSGLWYCRYFKVGTEVELAIYDWFSCRIYDDGASWVIEKTGGSQRTKGRLYNYTDSQLLYLGALYYRGEAAPYWFGDSVDRNQIALLSALADGRMRLEFPAPLLASEFDILELKRQ